MVETPLLHPERFVTLGIDPPKGVWTHGIDSIFANIEQNNVIGLKPGYDYSKLDKTTGLIKENEEVTENVDDVNQTQEEENMLVPISAWKKVLDQLGNLHEADKLMAEARERAAKAEAESEFLREKLKNTREELNTFKKKKRFFFF